MQAITQYFQANAWLIKIAIIAVEVLAVTWIAYLAYRRLLPHFERKQSIWKSSILKALYLPFILGSWVLGFTFALQIVGRELAIDLGLINGISTLRYLLMLVFILWFIMRLIRNLEQKFMASGGLSFGKKRVNNKTTISAISQLFRIAIIAVIGLIGLQAVGVHVSTLLAFGGVGTLVIGFAAKDTMANFLGGMMIYWDRPFAVGDWISSPDRQIEGTVESIGWRLTRIRTFDKRPLYVPNGLFSNILLENPQRMTNRRIKTVIGVRYEDASKIKDISADIETMLREHPEIDNKQVTFVKLIEFGSSSLNILIYTFTKTTNWVKFQAVQQEILLNVIDIVKQRGADFAFPTRTIQVQPESVAIEKTMEDLKHDPAWQ